MNRLRLLVVPLMLVGCSPSQNQAGPTRRITGQLSSLTLTRLENPAVVLRTADGQRVVAHVARTGEFKLDAPVGTSCHLGVATTTASGGLREDSTINWPNKWSRVNPGATIDLGVVHPRGQSSGACKREHDAEGGDDDDNDGCMAVAGARSDLPYDAKIPKGASFRLTDAFLEKGPIPAHILSVTMEGAGAWRLTELKANTPFTVTQADCTHAGNRSTGRDRIEVKWQNADGSTDSDHLDMRYCDGDKAPSANAVSTAAGHCGSTELCEEDDGDESDCDHNEHEGVQPSAPAPGPGKCGAAPVTPVVPTTTPAGGIGAACVLNADCASGLACFQSKCVSRLN